MTRWKWEGNTEDKTGYATNGSVRIKFESFMDFYDIMIWVDREVLSRTSAFAEQMWRLAAEMEGLK